LSLTTMSETLCAFLLMAALYLLFGRKRELTVAGLAGIGALLGVSILARPTTLLLLPFIAAAVIARPGESLLIRWREAALIVALSSLVMLPWLIRNHRLVGSYTMGSSASFNLVLGFGNAREIARLESGDRTLIDYRGRASTVYYGFSRDGYAYDQETEKAIMAREGLPKLFFSQVACAPRIWIGHEYPVIAEFALGTTRFVVPARRIDDLLWGLLAALFFIGAIGDLFLKDARERFLRWSLYAAIFATSLANACVGYSRMMVPVYPILLLGICAGIGRLAGLFRRQA
jgi:4-amino-4-deoxy-L-arabinose transferase-like glycosyltransferase